MWNEDFETLQQKTKRAEQMAKNRELLRLREKRLALTSTVDGLPRNKNKRNLAETE